MPTSPQFLSGGRPIRLDMIPAGAEGCGSSPHGPAILLLHGSGGHVEFWTARLGPALAEAGVSLFVPHYFDRTGTVRADLTTITDGVHVPQWLDTVGAALTFVSSRPEVDPQRVVLAGVSLGAFLALAFAAERSAGENPGFSKEVRALIAVSGGLAPPYDALATSRMPATLILHGALDSVVPVAFAHELDGTLTRLGVAHRTEILPGEGHWFSGAALLRILGAISAFLAPYISDGEQAQNGPLRSSAEAAKLRS